VGGVVGACYQPPTGGDRHLLQEQPNHGAVCSHVRAVASLCGHHRPLSLPTLKVQALLLLRRGVPEIGCPVSGTGVLTGLAGQENLLLMGDKGAVEVNQRCVLVKGYCNLMTNY
jgi:hypothetical protein